MKKILLLTLILISSLYPQIGSIYSSYGPGEPNTNFSVRRNGFGIGLTTIDNVDISSINPASWSGIQVVKLIGSFYYSRNSFNDNLSKNIISIGSFENLSLSFPIKRDLGIVLAGGIIPYTKMHFRTISPGQFFDTISYNAHFSGDGGLTNYFLGLSYHLRNVGSLGISANFLIGTYFRSVSTEFKNIDYINPQFNTNYKNRGIAYRIGYISDNLSKYVKTENLKDLKFGFIYTFPTNLTTQYSEVKTGIFIDTVLENSMNTHIPAQLGIGLSGRFGERANVYVDYFYQDWTKFSTEGKRDENLSSLSIYSLGIEILPPIKPENYLETISLRLGAYVKKLPIVLNSKKIYEYGLRTGFSLPIDQLNLIDFALQYSIRGSTKNSLIRESILSFWLGINFAEIWFVKNDE